MADPSDRGSKCDEMENRRNQIGSSSSSSSSSSQEILLKRTCADCGTSKTPLWRGGPAGPKSLCNACGIRNRKRRRALMALNNSINEKSLKKKTEKIKIKDSLKRRILELGRQVLILEDHKQSRTKLGEEEQAALLLMALSCGSVYA